MIHATPLPEITGDFDHLAVDLKRNHLFITAEVHHSVEVFDVRTGEHLQSIPGFKTPHSIAFSPEKDEFLVCDGGDSSLPMSDAAGHPLGLMVMELPYRYVHESADALTLGLKIRDEIAARISSKQALFQPTR